MRKAAFATAIALVFLSWAEVCGAEELARLSVQEVSSRLPQKGFYVFDNNSVARYQRGHVPGARNLNPYAMEPAQLPADHAATLVFYCGNEACTACHDGARAALKLGYKNVFIMPAGIAGWEKAGLPMEK